MMESNSVIKTMALRKYYNGARCAVMHCTNSTRKRDEEGLNISFHRFPSRNPELLKEWVKRCRPINYANMGNHHVCSMHFEKRFFCKKFKPGSKTKLVEGSVPTIHLPEPEGEIDQYIPPEYVEQNNSQSEGDPSFEQEVDMVELSSEGEDLGSFHQRKENQSAAVAIAASSAPQVSSRPSQLSNISKTANAMRQLRRKSSGTGEKNLNIVSETSMDGSVDSLKSDDDCDDDEISLIPNEELDYIDLQDPLETAYCSWKGMNEKARRATLRAYFSRIASFLPTRYPRNNKTTILTSAIHYLDEVTRDNLILGIEEEMLMQKHHVLRKHRGRLDKIIKKRRS